MKAEIPYFEGGIHPDEFIEWLHTIEYVLDLKHIPEDHKVKLVAIRLKKHGSICWESVKCQREREGRRKI